MKATSFTYLGIRVNYEGQLYGKQLIARNAPSAEKAMHIVSSIGISPTGVSKLLLVCLYTQLIGPNLKYGLAITTPNKQQQQTLEIAQNNCICHIYGARSQSYIQVMCHLYKLPSIEERTTFLQAKLLLSTYYLPDDALLTQMIRYLDQYTKSKWHLLNKSALWQKLPEPKSNTTTATFKATKRSYLMNELSQKISGP
ncbi:hypothetical protein INT45_010282 [Circinella minor]|uniref:Uncharacterized protein n=1 Tax=Circinella minor TaxID=1195481 RepID=A0A8H7RVC3_9FUNG|nr:hypothetical protein INT45_010282 [Circinella minor]